MTFVCLNAKLILIRATIGAQEVKCVIMTDRPTDQPTRQMDRRARREVSIPIIFTLFYLLELFLKVAGLAANAVYLYYTGEQWKIGKVNMGSFHKIIKLIL